ncbi:MAG: FAD-dependent oxidoreductase [Deltaproteobacteria bacterium]|nr:FAD-dependent oxidoreductase [Deltaproteobacteria bacterium]
MTNYQVIIIGAGPAGIFAALTLIEAGVTDVAIFDQGKDITERERHVGRDLLMGWGGAGAFSDGKLTISSEVGGVLNEFLPGPELERLLLDADGIYCKFGAPDRMFGLSPEKAEDLARKARLAGMFYIPSRVRHIGTDNCYEVLKNMRRHLDGRLSVHVTSQVEKITTKDGRVTGISLADGREFGAEYVISAPGRSGADWMRKQAGQLHLSSATNAVDIGLRIETPAVLMENLTNEGYECKLVFHSPSFDDKVRTFCMNPYGEVVREEYGDIITVNGHSYAGHKTPNTNFALLVSSYFTHPFHEPIAYGQHIARLANMLGNGPIVQRLSDLLAGRRSTPSRISRCITHPTLSSATPGDLSFVLPYRFLKSILEMLEAMEGLTPDIFSHHTLLYGVEVKFYSNRIKLSPSLESEVQNLFVIGDGAGLTRGLLQASASGILAGRTILNMISNN